LAIVQSWPKTASGVRDASVAALELSGCLVFNIPHARHFRDIWIRDWGPVAQTYFRYEPSYAPGSYSQRSVASARRHLNQHLGFTPREIPLILEGGNLVHSQRIAIVTEEKIFADNRHLTPREIERVILSLGFEKVIFIPIEPDDTVGHADGIVQFLGPDVLLVNDYVQPEFRAYRRRLYRRLEAANMGVEIVPFPWFCTNERHDGIWSAVGCYINLISTPRGIIYPTFSHPFDDRVAELLDGLTPLPKRSVEATALARLGGALHCATLTF
jgi:agmatine/peptidylarginine deiminase